MAWALDSEGIWGFVIEPACSVFRAPIPLIEPPPPAGPRPMAAMGGRRARGGSCPSGERRGSAAPGEDSVPSPDHKSLHTATKTINQGRKRWTPRPIPPRTVWKPQSHRLIAGWLGLVESSPPGEDKVSSPDYKSFRTSTTPTNRGRKR